MLTDLSLQGDAVVGEDEIGLLKGDGIVAVLDKNGIIYKFLTRLNWTLNNLDTEKTVIQSVIVNGYM